MVELLELLLHAVDDVIDLVVVAVVDDVFVDGITDARVLLDDLVVELVDVDLLFLFCFGSFGSAACSFPR